MRHQAGDVALAVADAGDVVKRAVGIARVIARAIGRGVAENHLAIFFEFSKRSVVDRPVAVGMRDGNLENLALGRGVGERSVGLLDADVNVAADEPEALVAHHGAGEQARFAQNLEAVADAEHQPAGGGKFLDGLHHRRKAGDGAGAQIVAVGESAGQNEGVAVREVLRLVPDELDGLLEDVSDGVKGVVVAIGPWKNNDSKFHEAVAPCGLAGTPILAQPTLTSSGRRGSKGAQAFRQPVWDAPELRRQDPARSPSRNWKAQCTWYFGRACC